MRGWIQAIFISGGLLWLVGLLATCQVQNSVKSPYQVLRERMVREQIEARGIHDPRVLRAMRKVERHKFVPEEYRDLAYEDHPLPIGEGQTISQPYIVALMTELLELDEHDRVLEVGTGSGYQAAVLAEICDSVYTIEIIESLGRRAEALLKELGYTNVKVKIGDGYKGWPEHAPFDGIIVTCAPTHIPPPLQEQLAEGGRMVIPVGERFTQELVLLRKENGKIIQREVIPVRFVPMLKEGGGEW
ncbi:MAG: protein-L-isoaspartate(D-aspartate) O-methyltransferase [Calditrichaeota bacterium]|nr:MAG: protein-L-isoaspartate(D-aspartate) O-methyltransferase [Calditrichota bacterium]